MLLLSARSGMCRDIRHMRVFGCRCVFSCCVFVKQKVKEALQLGKSWLVSIPTTSLQFIALGERSV